MTPNDISKESIELMVSECSSLLFNAADAAGMITHKIHRENKRQRQLNNKRVKRPWFDAECQRLRLHTVSEAFGIQRQTRRSKNHRRRVNNVENFQFLKETSKAYKKCLSKHFKEYKNECIKNYVLLRTQIQGLIGTYSIRLIEETLALLKMSHLMHLQIILENLTW